MENYVIETQGLTRFYGNFKAVDNLSLQVPVGSIYGFLGPNGAGKTTTIRMLLGLIRPRAGDIKLFGLPLKGNSCMLLSRVGSLVESPSLYPHLTGWENLEVVRIMTGGSRSEIERVLGVVKLENVAQSLVKNYSLGMRQRLGLAMALFGKPRLLILDEPTNGLDPAGIHEMRELICSLPQQGITVFLSSHLLNEVEQMASHIGIINDGQLVFQGTPDELNACYQDKLTLVTDRMETSQHLLNLLGWRTTHLEDHHLSVPVNGLSDVALINNELVKAGHQVYQLNLQHSSLEDIFLSITNQHMVGE